MRRSHLLFAIIFAVPLAASGLVLSAAAGNTGVTTGWWWYAQPRGAQIPSGMLHFILEAQDKAVAYGGTAASRVITPSDTQVRATRLLWSRVLNTSAAAVTGLAVHPDLDLIATTDGGVTTAARAAAPIRPIALIAPWSVNQTLPSAPDQIPPGRLPAFRPLVNEAYDGVSWNAKVPGKDRST